MLPVFFERRLVPISRTPDHHNSQHVWSTKPLSTFVRKALSTAGNCFHACASALAPRTNLWHVAHRNQRALRFGFGSSGHLSSGLFVRTAILLVAILLASTLLLATVSHANTGPRERWTLSSAAGTATLALVQDPGGRPVIMFVCGARLPGYAEVIISGGEEDLSSRRLRMDIEVGSVSAMASAQWSAGTTTAPSTAQATISVQKMAELMKANANMLSWRIDVSDRFDRPLASALLPSPFGRHRIEFLRFCA